jgi:NADPH:quinone reductase-like Zn-dependent oxidoreductase
MHIALARGAAVYATAGTEAKRQYVLSCGATAVMNSRTLAFADDVLASTKGRGVDVVLNTLSGDFIPASFRALSIGGRFIEVGKRGVFTEQQARDHRPDAKYHLFDLANEAERDQTLIPDLLHQLVGMIESATVPPLPVERLPFAAAKKAFRKIAEGRHTGKLVLSHRPSPEGAWLITGGFGALGLRAANWLVNHGVATIVLVGPRHRRPEAIEEIEARGVTVLTAEADCAEPEALRTIISRLPPGRPLRGVIHCAGTLADATLPRQDGTSFERVARAKFASALALHQATAGLELEAFILFSSAAAVLGSAGQANYAAANAMLHSIARTRRAQGQIALCIDWGPWTEGMATLGQVRNRDLGMMPISVRAGFAALDRLLAAGTNEACVLPLNSWNAFFAAQPFQIDDPFFAKVRPNGITTSGAVDSKSDVSDQLLGLAEQDRRRTLLDHLRGQLARVLGPNQPGPIPTTTPFHERGLDSLTSVELRNLLAKSLGVRLPTTLVIDYPTLDALCDHLLLEYFPIALKPTVSPDDAAIIASMSEEGAEAMLRRELENLHV